MRETYFPINNKVGCIYIYNVYYTPLKVITRSFLKKPTSIYIYYIMYGNKGILQCSPWFGTLESAMNQPVVFMGGLGPDGLDS